MKIHLLYTLELILMNVYIGGFKRLLLVIFFLYLAPLTLFFLIVNDKISPSDGVFFLGVGLFISGAFGIGLSFFLYSIKSSPKVIEKVVFEPSPPIEVPLFNSEEMEETICKLKESQLKLTKSIEEKDQINKNLTKENEFFKHEWNKISQMQSEKELLHEESLKGKDREIESLKLLIEKQKNEMELRQTHICQLDEKVHNLGDEIKTLLNVKRDYPAAIVGMQKEPIKIKEEPKKEASSFTVPEVQTESLHLLKKCLQTAQKMTGAHYLNHDSSRYREFSSAYYGIDQRRLFDLLRQETGGLVIVFSPKDFKPLFVNPESKNVLGWLPEKVASDFMAIIQPSADEWKKTLTHLKENEEHHLRLLAKTTEGKEVFLDTFVGLVPNGLFRDYVVAVCNKA